MTQRDLWPKINIEAHADNPVQILKEQANLLSEKTKNIIVGEVVTNTDDKVFYHSLYLNVPTLDNYRFNILKIAHTTMLYPLFIYNYTKKSEGIKPITLRRPDPLSAITAASILMTIDSLSETEVIIPEPDEKANSPEEFIEKLGIILKSDETKSILNSLINQTL